MRTITPLGSAALSTGASTIARVGFEEQQEFDPDGQLP